MKGLKLTIELVPATSWYANLRNKMSSEDWKILRTNIYAQYNKMCGICGSGNNRLECHEIWEYDDKQHIQSLKGFIALCEMCHHVKHIGRAAILAGEGKLNYDDVVKHFIDVNECDMQTFEKHRSEVFEKWGKRSKYRWKINLGKYESLIK